MEFAGTWFKATRLAKSDFKLVAAITGCFLLLSGLLKVAVSGDNEQQPLGYPLAKVQSNHGCIIYVDQHIKIATCVLNVI